MDYKTNTLKTRVELNETPFPELENVHCGALNMDTIVFDATAYLLETQIETIDHKTFMRANKRYIEMLCEINGKPTSNLFFQNTDGHILMSVELLFLFLSYVNPMLMSYFNSLLYDICTSGLAVNYSFIYQRAYNQLGVHDLKEMIENKTKENNDNEEQ